MSEEILDSGVVDVVPSEVQTTPVLSFPESLSPAIHVVDGECYIDDGVCVPFFDGINACKFGKELCFYIPVGAPDNETMKPVVDPPKSSKGNPMSNPHIVAPPDDSPVVDQVPVHVPVPADTHASMGVADSPNVLGLAQNGPIGGSTLALAAIAVLGGGAAFKFYSQFTKQNHERKLAEIEKSSNNNEENKKRCEGHAMAAANSTRELQMKLDDATKKLNDYAALVDTLNKKVADMETGMNKAIRAGKNIDDLEERIEEMEDKLKKKAKEKNQE